MILSDHARDEMMQAGITEDEVRQCLEQGELEIKQIVDGETRYGRRLVLKDKTFIVIYTFRDDEKRVVTAYIIRRKRTW
ncbi:MAG TPA: DUF4258 domain-containing protein [Candidatus Nanoarchaeia archaeon]|nr:DUF4258 domain-containing protein [Candidatus Nanoarchaeia archaeon]